MGSMIHPLAGKKASPGTLMSKAAVQKLFYFPEGKIRPIKNGTSGDRGLVGAGFCWQHVAAMSQALADIIKEKGHFGPSLAPELLARYTANKKDPIVVLGKDVRFASDEAQIIAARVLAANGITVWTHAGDRATPTPVISHTILSRNAQGEGIQGGIITASHNSARYAGYKSNGLDGGPNTNTKPIDEIANRYLAKLDEIKMVDYNEAKAKGMIVEIDLITPYVEDLSRVIRMDIVKIGEFVVTPLGGSAHGYYEAINARYNLRITVVNGRPDPAGENRAYDWDGELRGDPSSKFAMALTEGLANDNDADRFGGRDLSEDILDPN